MARGKKPKILTIILAGGQGERLSPLTRDRSKPAVPFGGIYRIIDFTLNNCLRSDLRKIEVLTQYKSLSLHRHLRLGWNLFNYNIGEYINMTPPQQRLRASWYQGTADAIYQNIYTLEQEKPDYVIILSGDHVYNMDYRKMLKFHIQKNADLTIGGVEVAREDATPFGVLIKNRHERITGFQEKPKDPIPIPEDKTRSLVSMGIYIFNTRTLVRRVSQDAKNHTGHDFGKDVIPAMVKEKDDVFVYSFRARGGGFAYWRDIGALDAYYQANMDLLKPNPPFDLHKAQSMMHTYYRHLPPARLRANKQIENCLISNGCDINGATITN
ncbi:MAG: glucose-1-phosphate adenylyltransferase, partial [Fibrobacteria bacterium]|nr:glucose-1-phosphate adenylyltransferase [Fibrobacteria bacterium]